MKQKKRIFVANFLSKKLQQTIEDWKEQFTNPVRWILPRNYHITLVPPWYEQNSEEVITLLRSVSKQVTPFYITFNTVSFGPHDKKPRLMWAKGESPKELITFKSFLLTALKKKEEKLLPLMHVTLARFTQKQYETFPEKKFSEKIQWQDQLKSFAVVESHLKRTGADYEIVEEIQL